VFTFTMTTFAVYEIVNKKSKSEDQEDHKTLRKNKSWGFEKQKLILKGNKQQLKKLKKRIEKLSLTLKKSNC